LNAWKTKENSKVEDKTSAMKKKPESDGEWLWLIRPSRHSGTEAKKLTT